MVEASSVPVGSRPFEHNIHYAKSRIRRIWAFVGSAWQWLGLWLGSCLRPLASSQNATCAESADWPPAQMKPDRSFVCPGRRHSAIVFGVCEPQADELLWIA